MRGVSPTGLYRLSAVGSTVSIKVWNLDDFEPDSWQYTFVDLDPLSAGHVGVGGFRHSPNPNTVGVDDFSAVAP
jgi:hypothetical protein